MNANGDPNEEMHDYEAESYWNDDLGVYGWDVAEDRARLGQFIAQKRQRGTKQEVTYDGSKRIRDDLRDDLEPWRKKPREGIDVDVPIFARGKGSPKETDPKHKMAQENVSPQKTLRESVPKNHLNKGKNDHDGKEGDKEGPLDPGHRRVKTQENLH